MGSVVLHNVTKQYGGQVVLENVTLELQTGETAALIGPNGIGKTTLFKLIAGSLPPDMGTVTRSKGLEVGYLPQEPNVPAGLTLRDAVAEAFADLLQLEKQLQQLAHDIAEAHGSDKLDGLLAQYDKINARFETAGGYSFEQRLDEVLGGLGFTPRDYELPVSALSGGQKCRAALGKLLLQDAQFLLLDEPTNHLDIDAVRWLEKFLAGHHGGAIIISHDRYLLDRLAEKTIEMAPGRNGATVRTFAGNYSNYVRTREVRNLTQSRQYEQDKAFLEKERAYIAKHMAGQRTRQAQGRLKRLERRLEAGEFVLEKPGEQQTMKLSFGHAEPNSSPGTRSDKEIAHADGLGKTYDDKVLFSALDVSVWGSQRLGITGPNGTGKSTLLKILLGQVEATAGEAWLAPQARVGYFAQEAVELHPGRTVVEEILAVRDDYLERDARNFAARFLFTDEDVFKRVGSLSGGEQSRVRFMKLMLTHPDVLILDEPTNHLDIPSRENLEAALADFPGTIIAVSHDRYFLDRMARKLLVMRAGETRYFNGNYTHYIEQVEQAKVAADKAASGGERKPQRGKPAAARPKKAPKTRFQKMKLDELEAFIAEHEQRIGELQERFGHPELYKDPEQLQTLQAEFETLKAELGEAEAAWLERADA